MAFSFFDTLSGAASGAAGGSAVPGIGTVAGGIVGGLQPFIGGLLGHVATDAVQQSADINKIAATNRVTPAHAAAVIAWHADHSSDRFNDLAAFVVTTNSRFASLLDEYNGANPTSPIYIGEVATTGAAAVQGLDTGGSVLTSPIPTPSQIVAAGSHLAAADAAASTTTNNMTKYALFGGGALVLLIALILLLKK